MKVEATLNASAEYEVPRHLTTAEYCASMKRLLKNSPQRLLEKEDVEFEVFVIDPVIAEGNAKISAVKYFCTGAALCLWAVAAICWWML